jgi:hypothetical protein
MVAQGLRATTHLDHVVLQLFIVLDRDDLGSGELAGLHMLHLPPRQAHAIVCLVCDMCVCVCDVCVMCGVCVNMREPCGRRQRCLRQARPPTSTGWLGPRPSAH